MTTNQILIKTVTSYFEEHNWHVAICQLCKKFFLSKTERNGYCPRCKALDFRLEGKKYLSDKKILPHSYVAEKLENHFKQGGVYKAPPLPIWKTHNNETFVGSGLEYIDGYRYRGMPLPKLPLVVYQPSIRLKGGILENIPVYENDLSSISIAFINVSFLYNCPQFEEFPLLLDNMITAFSDLGIHAHRVSLVVDNKEKSFGDGYTTVCKVWIFIDDLEIGDHLLLLSKNGLENIVESGIGLERLTAKVFHSTFSDIISSKFTNDLLLRKFLHALTLIGMSDIPYANEAAWSKAKTIANVLKKEVGKFDSFLICQEMYNYWHPFLNNPSDKFSSYLHVVRLLTQSN